ncbi:MAG: Maf family protein [Candidatus Omnitrophica bacterium]|nr:Maf family protein [Candidatus Omnitrophota bacterium]
MRYKLPKLGIKIKRKIILASASPRRAKLFRQLGLKFIVSPPMIKERRVLKHGPAELVKANAFKKAEEVAKRFKEGIIVGADTVVFVKGKIIGKPNDYQEAKKFLRLFSRYPHWVYSGIAIIDVEKNTFYIDYEKTKVIFRKLNEKDIEDYLSDSVSLDRAGGIDIEERARKLVKEIDGDFYNIVGLPVKRFVSLIRKIDKRFQKI